MNESNIKEAVFAGGCFWCMEAPFVLTPGVLKVKSGYTGGDKKFPTYEEVCTGSTGHYEAVKIWYDEAEVSYKNLLGVFIQSMNPTDPYGQFADRGSQYLGAIFYASDEEKQLANKLLSELDKSNIFESQVAIKLLPQTDFYEAEEYHQEYYKKNKLHYKAYRRGSGRAPFLEKIWTQDNINKLNEILSKLQ